MSYWEDSCLRMVRMVKMVRSCSSLPNASAHIQRNPDPRPVRRSNSVGYGKENQLFVKDNESPGAKSVTRPVK